MSNRLKISVHLVLLAAMAVLMACEPHKRQTQRAVPRPVAPPTTSQTEPPLPKDPAVRHGQLANGLTYYIRENQEPANRAELRLVVNAGSLLEEDDQQGLAHFLEHMAFNGTKNFEKKAMVNYLQSIGMEFGAHVNAMTNFEETVYLLRVPTDDEGIVDTAFQMLDDWATGISLDPEEVEAERGVVIEEWRLSLGAQNRVRQQQIPKIFYGARHAERIPIGKKDILENAPVEALRRFYQRWYRPDLMAVIAVGDFDGAAMEKRIRKQFEDLKKPKQPAKRTVFQVPDHEETFFLSITDPELTQSEINIYYKHPSAPSGTKSAYRASLVTSLAETMLNRRLAERSQTADPPFIYGYTGESNLARTKSLIVQAAAVKDGNFRDALVALLEASRQVALHGYTQSEFDREKKGMLRNIAKAYEERDKTRSAVYAGEYQRNFLVNESFPGIEVEYELYKTLLPTITLAEVNKVADDWFKETNRVIFVTAPEKEKDQLPSKETILGIIDEVSRKDVPAYEDRALEQELLNTVPDAGEIVSESKIEAMDITEWTLSNGAKVILKPTDFKNDQVLFRGNSPGGNSLVEDDDIMAAITTTAILNASGLGDFDAIQLNKKLQGKRVGVSPFLGTTTEGLSGGASTKDIETLFELIYLTFTGPRFDEAPFESIKSRWQSMVANRLANPNVVFQNRISEAMYGDHPRHLPMSMERLEGMDLETSRKIYEDRFADASDFTFFFVGNFDHDKLRPLVETYLASLPSLDRKETWRDTGDRIKEGKQDVIVRKGLEPKATVRLFFHGPAEWTSENRLNLSALNDIIKLRLYDTLREEKGGTYGVGVGGSIDKEPTPSYLNRISFGCSPENVEELVQETLKELKRLAEEGVEESYLVKMRETKLRNYEDQVRSNNFWISNLAFVYQYGFDPTRLLDYEDRVKAIDNEDIRKAAKTFYNSENFIKAVLLPEKESSP